LVQELIILNFAVLGAAALQSATGIGFGVIAGPVLLTQLNSGNAIQISIILNLLIAVILTFSYWRNVNRQLLLKFIIGTAVGLPVGVYIALNINLLTLKVLAGLTVLWTFFSVLHNSRSEIQESCNCGEATVSIPVGVVSGIIGASLAMPGPIPAAWMTRFGCDKETIRATILALFLFSYTGALLLQVSLVGIVTDTLSTTVILVPATLIGIFLGRFMGVRFSQSCFRLLILFVLASSAALLFWSVF
jgi:uncharacterized membrane protein YfcA